jgi:hypothetical protein
VRRGLLQAALLLSLAPAAVAGPGTPGPDYFRGLYDRVGRTGAEPSAVIDDRVTIEPAGLGLLMRDCAGQEVRLVFDPWHEAVNFLAGTDGRRQFVCLFHNNGENYPILTCEVSDGARFTLWPRTANFRDAPIACG